MQVKESKDWGVVEGMGKQKEAKRAGDGALEPNEHLLGAMGSTSSCALIQHQQELHGLLILLRNEREQSLLLKAG